MWKSVDDSHLIRYRCLQALSDNRYYVKAADHYYSPLTRDQIKDHNWYFLESLLDGGLELAEESWYDTLGEAIAKFDEDFENPAGV